MKTVACYRVKNEASWIASSLQRTLQCSDCVILLDDHSTDGTPDIARSFNRVRVVDSPFIDFDEARDKNFLLKEVLTEGADWVLFLDGDEELTNKAVREIRDIVKIGLGGIFHFRMAYLWDAPDQERIDAVYANFQVPRLFSVFDQKKESLFYHRTKHGGNLHCGQIPAGAKLNFRGSNTVIKHYGYMRAEDRKRKHVWYNSIDTSSGRLGEGSYDHVIGKSNRIAPGPVILRSFVDE